MPAPFSVIHNRVPNRIRLRVPMIRHKQTFAELLKQSLLRDVASRGIYHAEPYIVTGSMLIKYHLAMHSEREVLELVDRRGWTFIVRVERDAARRQERNKN